MKPIYFKHNNEIYTLVCQIGVEKEISYFLVINHKTKHFLVVDDNWLFDAFYIKEPNIFQGLVTEE